MAWWQLVESNEERLVRPVSHEAQYEAGKVEGWDRGREHHDDPDHGNEHREAGVVFDQLACVERLVLLLHNLLGLLLVTRAAPIQALLPASLCPF